MPAKKKAKKKKPVRRKTVQLSDNARRLMDQVERPGGHRPKKKK